MQENDARRRAAAEHRQRGNQDDEVARGLDRQNSDYINNVQNRYGAEVHDNGRRPQANRDAPIVEEVLAPQGVNPMGLAAAELAKARGPRAVQQTK